MNLLERNFTYPLQTWLGIIILKYNKIVITQEMQFGIIYPNQNLGLGKKLSLKWKGPYIVLRKMNDVLYKIGKNSKHKGTTSQ